MMTEVKNLAFAFKKNKIIQVFVLVYYSSYATFVWFVPPV